MSVFDTAGEAQMMMGEGNRQILLALVAGACKGLQQLTRLLP